MLVKALPSWPSGCLYSLVRPFILEDLPCRCPPGFLSPTLFNFFLHDLPDIAPLQPGYADDLNAASLSSLKEDNDVALTLAASRLKSWVDDNRMAIAPQKSEAILFSNELAEASYVPAITIAGTCVPLPSFLPTLGPLL